MGLRGGVVRGWHSGSMQCTAQVTPASSPPPRVQQAGSRQRRRVRPSRAGLLPAASRRTCQGPRLRRPRARSAHPQHTPCKNQGSSTGDSVSAAFILCAPRPALLCQAPAPRATTGEGMQARVSTPLQHQRAHQHRLGLIRPSSSFFHHGMPSSQQLGQLGTSAPHSPAVKAEYDRSLHLSRTEKYAEARLAFEALQRDHPRFCKAFVSHAQVRRARGCNAWHPCPGRWWAVPCCCPAACGGSPLTPARSPSPLLTLRAADGEAAGAPGHRPRRLAQVPRRAGPWAAPQPGQRMPGAGGGLPPPARPPGRRRGTRPPPAAHCSLGSATFRPWVP